MKNLLTTLEIATLRAIYESEYHDSDQFDFIITNTVWSTATSKSDGGVYSSLIKKGLIHTDGAGNDATVRFTEAAREDVAELLANGWALTPEVGSKRLYKDFYTPDIIAPEDNATAYFHSLGDDDRAHILAKIYPPSKYAEALEKYTHILSRWANLSEIWATDAKRPHNDKAEYTRLN